MRRILPLLATCLLMMPLMGCYNIVVPIYKATFSPNADHDVLAYEARIKKAKPIYEAKVKTFRADIALHKEKVKQHLDAQELVPALTHLDALYKLTHPCREEDCGTYPCGNTCSRQARSNKKLPPLNKYECYLEIEDIDNEREFILSAIERAYELTATYRNERRFDEADVGLTKYAATIAGPDENAARFKKRHKEIKQAWLDVLIADAEQHRQDRPGYASLLYAKATDLATQRDDAALVEKLRAQALSLRAQVHQRYKYTIAVGSTSGPYVGELVNRLLETSFDGHMSVSKASKGQSALKISTSPERYRRATASTSSSFRYISGTREVPNPAYQSAVSSCKSAQRSYQSEADGCAKQPTNSAGQSTRQCDGVSSYASKAERACASVDQYPETVSEDVYADQSYPVTLNHLTTVMGVGATISFNIKSSGGPINVEAAQARLTDRAHAAHERNGSGVAADPERPPSESEGLKAVKSAAYSELKKAAVTSFERYRADLVDLKKDSDEAGKVDALATFIFLNPKSVPKERVAQLEAASKITGAAKLLQGLK